MSTDPMEALREKEKEYAFYGFSVSSIKYDMKRALEDMVNSAIDSSEKKLSRMSNCSEEAVKEAIEKMRAAYISSIRKDNREVDELIEEAFKLPPDFEVESDLYPEQDVNEDELNAEIMEYEHKLAALTQYRKELLKTEAQIGVIPDLSQTTEFYTKLEATSEQLISQMELVTELFSVSDGEELDNNMDM